jgi:hypothetical protein
MFAAGAVSRSGAMLKKIVIGVLGLLGLIVGVVLLLAAMKPDTFRVERKAAIQASASDIFPHLADFHEWAEWSPWEHLDPKMQKTYSGPPSGVGASYAWSGSSDVGEGRMTVIESRPDEELKLKLEFIKPFESTNITTYRLVPISGNMGTQVTWTMEGPNSFMGKLFSVIADMDAMIGKDFETGLANLKRVSESGATAQH